TDRGCVEYLDLQPDGGRGFVHVPYRGLGGCRICRVDDYGNASGPGHPLALEAQPLCHHLPAESIDSRGGSATPGEACGESKLDWVFANDEYGRDGRCCSFGRERMNCAAGRDDHSHLSADEIGDHCLQAIVLALRPMVLDRHVLAFDVAGFVKAFAEGGHKM